VDGGDVLIKGRRADGKPWRIGLQHPRQKQKLIASLELENGSVFTSGDYEHYWMIGGRRVHHIFDPRTGCSCLKNQSLSLWGPGPVETDIIATGIFCWDRDSILAFVERRPRFQCLVVDSAGRVAISRGWNDRIQWDE
jgi:thiamine biosynthesis lipoprotein